MVPQILMYFLRRNDDKSVLLAMLAQMVSSHGKLEKVLTIGATNLAEELDQALLRPGRFEVGRQAGSTPRSRRWAVFL
ncbi:hypothetical protein DUNSADRAFT_13753 [Dunaliella salina]|uniref:ATPase AAA-type core domain-containing protein n=1 Tax=Dunaliella salina TaxID=3046 RepID=A0ABQ7G8R3_DUNSA|nr:hypothetical protein DUNSADRAFT_13753 [Dunaliella salina]|eukprot:KAF5830997.1 hypothetical protein DUNSADRAFT_13753 [Dunaliella salina]